MLIGLKLRYSAAVRKKQMDSNNTTDIESNTRNGSAYSKYQSTKRPLDSKNSANGSNSLAQRRAVIKMLSKNNNLFTTFYLNNKLKKVVVLVIII